MILFPVNNYIVIINIVIMNIVWIGADLMDINNMNLKFNDMLIK